jgi:hypothetical protein
MCSGGVCLIPGVRAQEGALQRLSGGGEARQGALYARLAARRDRDPVLWHHYQSQKGALFSIKYIYCETELVTKVYRNRRDED